MLLLVLCLIAYRGQVLQDGNLAAFGCGSLTDWVQCGLAVGAVEDAIRVGGLADIKASRIKVGRDIIFCVGHDHQGG